MNKKIIATFCCFIIFSILIGSSFVIAKENVNGKPDLCDKFEDKKNKWEHKWENKELEDKDWGNKWEEKREKKIEKLDDKKEKFCDECDDDNGDDDNGDDNGDDNNGDNGGSSKTKTMTYIKKDNISPISDTSAGEPYIGFINEDIIFNGSNSYDPDGFIIEFSWEISDGALIEGEIVSYKFNEIGNYDVKLTVKDNNGAINSSKTVAIIIKANNPPTKPIIEGTSFGVTNSLYDFKIVSNDSDGDDIRYYVDWGNGDNISSQFVKNGTEIIFQYSWNISGNYTISVRSFDGLSFSESTEFEIEIGIQSASIISDLLVFILLILILISIFLYLYLRNKEKPKKV